MICYKSVTKYCKDYTKIENYDKAIADETQTWVCHHRLEIAPFSGKTISARRLIELGLYYNVSPNALIFLPKSIHSMLHGIGNKSRTGMPHTEETKIKMSKSQKGRVFSYESKQKMSKSHKGKHLSEETRKKMSEARKGEKNPNFGKPKSEETKKKMSEAHKGQIPWNKGKKGKHWKIIDGKRVWY